MVTLVFDGKMGASGDMIIGALLSAGANVEVLSPIEEELGIKYDIKELVEQGISAKQVRVTRGGKDIEGENSGKNFEEIVKVIRSLSISKEVVSNAIEVFRALGEAEAEVHGKKLEEVNKIHSENLEKIENEKITALEEVNNVIKVKGDWTKPDKKIQEFLNSYNRFGIPFNVIYSYSFPKGVVLSEILTKKDIIDNIKKMKTN